MKAKRKIGNITSVGGIKDAYSRRILGNLIGKDPLAVYRRTPGALARLTRGLTRKELHTPPSSGKWSIARLVSHLCDAEIILAYRIRKAIAEPDSPLQAYDENKWATRLHDAEMNVPKRLALFAALRASHLELIRTLSSTELRRAGIHAERGRESVERMVQLLAGHDINHLRQVKNARRRFERK